VKSFFSFLPAGTAGIDEYVKETVEKLKKLQKLKPAPKIMLSFDTSTFVSKMNDAKYIGYLSSLGEKFVMKTGKFFTHIETHKYRRVNMDINDAFALWA